MLEIDVPALIAALRSGDYEQGTTLSINGKHCCLGVACEIDPRIEKQPRVTDDGFREHFRVKDSENQWESSFLPVGLRFPDYMGLSGDMARCNWIAPGESLVSFNDDDMPFEHIADVLEYIYVNNAPSVLENA